MIGECSRLKAWVIEVEGTMRETLESMDKLQADLNEALTSNLGLEHRVKSAEDQVVLLQHQVLELHAQANKA